MCLQKNIQYQCFPMVGHVGPALLTRGLLTRGLLLSLVLKRLLSDNNHGSPLVPMHKYIHSIYRNFQPTAKLRAAVDLNKSFMLLCLSLETMKGCFAYSPPETMIRHLVTLFMPILRFLCLPGLYRVAKTGSGKG